MEMSFHEILGKFPQARKFFDHAYITRLVNSELAKVRDEIKEKDMFFGRAHPMKTADVMNQVYGESCTSHGMSSLTLLSPRKQRQMARLL